MQAFALLRQEATATHKADQEVINLKDFTFYVHLTNGGIQEVAPATGLRLAKTEAIFVLGEIVVTRLPARDVYFVTREPAAPPPVLF